MRLYYTETSYIFLEYWMIVWTLPKYQMYSALMEAIGCLAKHMQKRDRSGRGKPLVQLLWMKKLFTVANRGHLTHDLLGLARHYGFRSTTHDRSTTRPVQYEKMLWFVGWTCGRAGKLIADMVNFRAGLDHEKYPRTAWLCEEAKTWWQNLMFTNVSHIFLKMNRVVFSSHCTI